MSIRCRNDAVAVSGSWTWVSMDHHATKLIWPAFSISPWMRSLVFPSLQVRPSLHFSTSISGKLCLGEKYTGLHTSEPNCCYMKKEWEMLTVLAKLGSDPKNVSRTAGAGEEKVESFKMAITGLKHDDLLWMIFWTRVATTWSKCFALGIANCDLQPCLQIYGT